ncbi:MAG: assimilatory sulfite reductase (NADPH) flavoprotein subunit, partial [Lysobacter sp.]|nr:assimilatory sulfite reductase (NADPH) flavoprotein subunit [Lysobacter sp.]
LVAQAERAGDVALTRLLDDPQQLAPWVADRQVIDVLREHRADWDADALVAALRPLAPRLYSIASSQKAVGEEAHLTVAHVEYAAGDARRWGAASHFLAASAEGAGVPVYVEANDRFRLPADTARDVIMVGPGTGVAPFRGFLQERVADGARGRHWLYFGNPHFRSDFLYQLEWQDALARGQLQRLDLAFSRDGAAKTYVQHRLLERGRELFDWLEGGAHLYVCGATAMARDVHAALGAVVREHGGLGDDAATDYLDALQRQGRYARDTY